jgi:hypothetical protein
VPAHLQRTAAGVVTSHCSHAQSIRACASWVPASLAGPCTLGGARPLYAADRKRADNGGVDCDLLDQLETSRLGVGERGATCDTRERTAREGCACHYATIDMGMSARERASGQQGVLDPAHIP